MSWMRRNGAKRLPGMIIGLLAAAGLVWQSSNATLSADTRNGSSAFGAGNITLTDDDSGTAMFNATGMMPGDDVTNCIEVTYSGSSYAVTAVKLFGELDTNVGGFADHLDVNIEQGTGGEFGDCSGFTPGSTLYTGTLANLATSNHDFATGLTGFTPSSGDVTRTYRYTVTLGSDTPNSAMSDSAAATFTWEIRSA